MTNAICKTIISVTIIIAIIFAINVTKDISSLWALILVLPIWIYG